MTNPYESPADQPPIQQMRTTKVREVMWLCLFLGPVFGFALQVIGGLFLSSFLKPQLTHGIQFGAMAFFSLIFGAIVGAIATFSKIIGRILTGILVLVLCIFFGRMILFLIVSDYSHNGYDDHLVIVYGPIGSACVCLSALSCVLIVIGLWRWLSPSVG
jgi:hypothetical protein